MGFFQTYDSQSFNQNSTQSQVSSAIRLVTERLLKVWAPNYSEQGRASAIYQTVGEKVAYAKQPPVVGVGHSMRGGVDTLELATDVESDDLDLDRLRKVINTPKVPVHVVETGEWVACSRPVQGGDSIGYPNGATGTVTCLVRNKNGELFLLSCNHVIAAMNQGQIDHDKLWHPGKADGGGPNNIVGDLHDYQPLDFSVEKPNIFDAALCRPSGDTLAGLFKIGPIAGVLNDPPFELPVKKIGRSTHLTEGAVLTKNSAVLITYAPGKKALFENQVQIVGTGSGDFAQEGDSGALVVDRQNRAVGLLFSVSVKQNAAFASPIKPVFDRFAVEPVLGTA